MNIHTLAKILGDDYEIFMATNGADAIEEVKMEEE